MPAMLAHRDAQRFGIAWHIRAGDHQVHLGHLLFAPPETHCVPYQIDSRASIFNFIRTDHVLELHAHLGAGIVERQPRERGIFFQPPPVPFVGKRFPAYNAHRREQPPAANQSSLPRRPPHLVHCLQLFVMKHKSMNHASTCPSLFKSATSRIVPEYPCVPVGPLFGISNAYIHFGQLWPLTMAIGVGFRPLKGRYLKAQQFTEDLWLDGKSILVRRLLRARKWPATGSTNRTKCSKMGQLAPSFQFLIPSCLAIFPRLQFPTRPPALPAVSPLFTSGVRYSASPSSSSTACWIAPRSIFRFGPASAPGIRQWDSRSRYLWGLGRRSFR